MELLRVQAPKSNILAVGDYLRADGPFGGYNDNFDPVLSSKEIHRVQLNVEIFFILTVRLHHEVIATGKKKSIGTQTKTPSRFSPTMVT
jgi:hypothetical protein